VGVADPWGSAFIPFHSAGGAAALQGIAWRWRPVPGGDEGAGHSWSQMYSISSESASNRALKRPRLAPSLEFRSDRRRALREKSNAKKVDAWGIPCGLCGDFDRRSNMV
jgi:hypothetical protein